MNAVTSTLGKSSKPGAFTWLLKREFWENRGGFFWAHIFTGVIFLVMTALGLVIASVLFQKARNEEGANFDVSVGAEHAQQMGFAGDMSLLIGVGLAFLVLAFVVFFYSLGSLYDDRRDRSILFWKSMPISDRHMVLSKLSWALVLGPALAVVIGLCIGTALWLLSVITAALNGLPVAGPMVVHAHPLRIIGGVISTLPVYALWALPTVGWLMFCSAWARRLPFLWAVLVPLLSCAMISLVAFIVSLATNLQFPYASLWYAVWYRGVGSVLPGTWYALPQVRESIPAVSIETPDDIPRAIDLTHSWYAFTTPDLWIGAAIGVALIVGAIYLRRWRESE